MSESEADAFYKYVKLAFDRELIAAEGFEFLSNELEEGISPDTRCEAYSKFFINLIMYLEDHQQEKFLCQCLAAIMTITNSTETNMMHLKNFLGHLGHSECSSSVRKMAVHHCITMAQEMGSITVPKSLATLDPTTGGLDIGKTASTQSKLPAPIDLTSSQLDLTKAATTKPKQRPINPRGIKRGVWQAIVKSAHQELDAMNLVEQTPKHYKALMRR